jgi:hypothetical protein
MKSKGLMPFGRKRSWVQLRIHCFSAGQSSINQGTLPRIRLLDRDEIRFHICPLPYTRLGNVPEEIETHKGLRSFSALS